MNFSKIKYFNNLQANSSKTTMKKTLLFALVFLCSFTLNARQVAFLGTVNNPMESTVTVSFIHNELLKEEMVYKTNLNEENSFGISIDIGQNDWVSIKHGDQKFKVFVSRKDTKIEFKFDGPFAGSTLQFVGNNVYNNSLYQSFNRSFKWAKEEKEIYSAGGLSTIVSKETVQKAKSYAAEDYFRNIQTEFDNQQRYLQSQTNMDLEFYKYMEKAISWRYETHKIIYFLYNKERIAPTELRTYWVRYGLLRNTDVNDDSSIKYPEYQNLLNAFVHYLDLELPGNPDGRDFSYYQFINGNLTGKSRFFMLAKVMLETYQMNGNPRLAQRKFKAYRMDNPYPEYSKYLEDIFGSDLQFVPKDYVPDFKMLSQNGDPLFLSDYRGKVVYISFWASWCGPCIKGFRETHMIRSKLSKSGVVFLNVNLDETEDLWRKTIDRIQVAGENVYGIDLSKLKGKMDFSALPHYILMNKQGMLTFLTTDNLNRASSDFEELLMQ